MDSGDFQERHKDKIQQSSSLEQSNEALVITGNTSSGLLLLLLLLSLSLSVPAQTESHGFKGTAHSAPPPRH